MWLIGHPKRMLRANNPILRAFKDALEIDLKAPSLKVYIGERRSRCYLQGCLGLEED